MPGSLLRAYWNGRTPPPPHALERVRDPYLIWLSEIILQQTRVEQGLPYFERFRARFPTVESLAAAPDDEVFKLWEGLGYYSRARNLLETARYIAGERGGKFPETYEGIKAMKGIGPYTAAAIASFAFDLPHAVVDGNVYRVLARVFGLVTPVDSTDGKRLFSEWAQKLLDIAAPGVYNQAIMDFGAIQCKPASPACGQCPMQSFCRANQTGKVDELPVKARRLAKRVRYFHYLVLRYEGKLLLRKRTAKDIWQHLYDFPLVESEQKEMDLAQLQASPAWKTLVGKNSPMLFHCSQSFQQTLSHQHIIARFWEFDLPDPWVLDDAEYIVEERENLTKFAFPKIVDWYLKKL
ncbi:MAG: A/G-specific adenine glycosylase [Saprospirales bacterium]|nr:A/G-specific adenine glycosylase [Saprospirales bacterium]